MSPELSACRCTGYARSLPPYRSNTSSARWSNCTKERLPRDFSRNSRRNRLRRPWSCSARTNLRPCQTGTLNRCLRRTCKASHAFLDIWLRCTLLTHVRSCSNSRAAPATRNRPASHANRLRPRAVTRARAEPNSRYLYRGLTPSNTGVVPSPWPVRD